MRRPHGRDRSDLRYGDTAGGEHVREHGLGLEGPRPARAGRPRPAASPASRRRRDSAVPPRQGDEPAAREVAVVGQLLHALGSDGSEHGVRVRRQPLEQGEPVGGEHQHPAHRLGEVTVRQLDQAARCGSRGRRGRTRAGPRRAPGSPRGARARRSGRRPRPAPAAAGPGRAGRGRCWPARCPPRGPARGCTTPRGGGTGRARRRRGRGSRRPARGRRSRPGPSCRLRPAGPRSRCRRPSGSR